MRSEGFFGLQDDPSDPAMSLMIDYDVFYEFIPMDEFGTDHPTVVPLQGIEVGKKYAMNLCYLLWFVALSHRRLCPMFTSKNPLGSSFPRTYQMLSMPLVRTHHGQCRKGIEVCLRENRSAGGRNVWQLLSLWTGNAVPPHQWLIEFSKEPASLDEFASLLDKHLQEINSDYEAKRFHDVTLQHLEIVKARPNLFNDWLKSKGKLGGQHKVPRLSNSRKNIDEMLELNKL